MNDERRPRPRGRPKELDEPGSKISAWIFVRHHDALVHVAQRRRVSVSAVVRTLITKGLADLHEK